MIKHGMRILVVPATEPSAIDYLFKVINCSELGSYKYLQLSECFLCSPLLEENNGVWTRRKSETFLQDLSFEVVPANSFSGIYTISWIQYGANFFRFSNSLTVGKGISLSAPPSKKSGL